MHDLGLLGDLVLLLGVALPVVLAANRVRIPAIVGFLAVGVLIGPHGLALIAQPEAVSELAEIGVVLLLFTIGLELSLSRILQLGREVLQGGLLQVLATMATVGAVAVGSGVPLNRAVFYGALAALSSTAIVLRVYADRGELDSPPGRIAVSILLFQDLMVLPLMLLVPILAGVGEGEASRGWVDFAQSTLVVAALIVGGRFLVPRLLDWVALARNREVFTLSLGFIGLGAAYVTSSFGLSLALGSFLAGLVISESEYGLQALSDVRPFRDAFSGIFFTSVGMLLDVGFVLSSPSLVLGIALAVVVVKGAIAAGVVLTLGRSFPVGVGTGLGLAQIGEFSFVLASVGVPLGLLPGTDEQLFLAAAVLTLIAAPFLIAAARPLADLAARATGRSSLVLPSHEQEAVSAMSGHAIVVGYGLSGRRLIRVLQAAGIPFVGVEQNGRLVRQAREDGVRVFFGDGTDGEVLERLGLERARVLVFAISSPVDERRGIAAARRLNPTVRIIIRTRYVLAIGGLMRLGANEVVVEEFEATLELFARVLEFYEIPTNTIQRELDALRDDHYGMLRGELRPDFKLHALRHLRIHEALDLVEVEASSPAVGESATTLELRRRTGAVVIAVVRSGRAIYQRDPEFKFRSGDTVVLVGDAEALESGRAVFRASE